MVTEEKILTAFRLYSLLAVKGEAEKKAVPEYFNDEDVFHLVSNFAREVSCCLVTDEERLYLVPLAQDSPFHITNEQLKKGYLPAKAVNMDIYLMYLCIIVLFGCFYDSDSAEPVDFVDMERWLEAMNERMASLALLPEEKLRAAEAELQFNWVALLTKWNDMDSLKESVKKQDARTSSRLSTLNQARDFLLRQGFLEDIGAGELQLTGKARAMIRACYMEQDSYRTLMDFMYQLDHQQKEESHAENQ